MDRTGRSGAGPDAPGAAARTGGNEVGAAFVFVPHGDPEPVEWMARHRDWVRIPATMRPRDARQPMTGPTRRTPPGGPPGADGPLAWAVPGGEAAGGSSDGGGVVLPRPRWTRPAAPPRSRDAMDPVAAFLRANAALDGAGGTPLPVVDRRPAPVETGGRNPGNAPAPAPPPANPVATMTMSAASEASLRASEGHRNRAYNDVANNCTNGTGHLLHYGPCTAAELAQSPDQQADEAAFQRNLHTAEAVVRDQVTHRALTQDQFDSLVSAAFNLGAGHVAGVTAAANRGDDAGVQRELRSHVFIHHHDAHGNPIGPAIRNQGLVNRREREALPFAPAPGQQR